MVRKDLSKEQILMAIANTKSNRAAARYLNCSYQHYRRWAKLYDSDELKDPNDPSKGYKSLLEKHSNPSGKGIPKFLAENHKGGIDRFPILDIIEGRVNSDSFAPEKIKDAMVRGNMLKEECYKCGFKERRVIDYKMPLLMWFPDGNKKNYKEVQLVCYNCYFVYIGDVFNRKQLKHIEDHTATQNKVEWELDEYHLKRLEEITKLGKTSSSENTSEDDPYSLVSRKITK